MSLKRKMPAAHVPAMSRPPAGLVTSPLGNMEGDGGARLLSTMGEIRNELTRISGEQRQKLDTLENRLETVETVSQDLAQMVAGRTSGRFGSTPSTLGEQVVRSDAFRALQANPDGKARIKITNAITTAAGSGGALIAPDVRTDPIVLPRRRLTIRDLLAKSATTSNLVEYAKQVTRTNGARVVTEGSAKPETVLEWQRAEAPVRTIAHIAHVSRQAMDDAGPLQAVIDDELTYGLFEKEEDQLLKGDGSGENLTGLISEATPFSAPFAVEAVNAFDRILQGYAQLAAANILATAVVLNPVDHAQMLAIKDGQERYIGGGPLAEMAKAVWQLPVVLSVAMDVGDFLIGDFARAATIYDRMDVEVLISSEHGDNFIKNMLTVRAEKRLALAITMPSALVHGELPIITG